ncbi:metallophosphoesterase [Holdemanella biformis]|uniref:metallophosphoesterase n=1 Tax=Holdemanella biformis TaxID=1735 RepID=UPI0024918C0E|nr:metallophosphoesterase [Holdemanella biformis]
MRQPTTSQQQKKSQTPNFYLLGKDFVNESTSEEDMNVLFKQLGRLTKVAPVYFVYGNHENKIKFTRNKLNQEIIKNNITILNDQEVHLNNIILIGRKDYTKIISSGLVGWGIPIRTEGISEYVVVNVTPDN